MGNGHKQVVFSFKIKYIFWPLFISASTFFISGVGFCSRTSLLHCYVEETRLQRESKGSLGLGKPLPSKTVV
jgi:hypothetical protein